MKTTTPKKKILFSIHYLELGGAEKSLIALLKALPKEKFAIDLFVYRHSGELMNEIPPQVRLLDEIGSYAAVEKPLKRVLFSRYWKIGIARIRAKIKHKRYARSCKTGPDYSIFQYIANEVTPLLPPIGRNETYDLAASYLLFHNIVLEKVKAKQKWAWIHTDYSSICINRELEEPVWGKYDRIISISDEVTHAFLSIFPSLKEKILKIENMIDVEGIKEKSLEKINEGKKEDGTIHICSIGRFCDAKNFDNAVWMCKYLHEMDLNVKWYIIGYGNDEQKIRDEIEKAHMEDSFILLGKKTNPYPYIKACDIYIQPSRYEGKSITVQEAQVLCKPVIITRYPTSSSQITDGVDGIIVPLDNKKAAEGIANLIQDKDLQQKIIENLHQKKYNQEQISIFEKVV